MPPKNEKGSCRGCNRKNALAKTLVKHVKECPSVPSFLANKGGDASKVPGYLLQVADKYRSKQYWLLVAIPKTMKLTALDAFLRKIWLECCGHMSQFSVSMKLTVEEAFQKSSKALSYQYDFGSTTFLTISKEGDLANVPSNRIVVIARNEESVEMCEICKEKPATWLHHTFGYTVKCDDCKAASNAAQIEAQKEEGKGEEDEDFDEGLEDSIYYKRLRNVNSPRSGDCGYTGAGSSEDFVLDGEIPNSNEQYEQMSREMGLGDDDDEDDEDDEGEF